MKRGSVWWIQFDPSVGSEIQKTRPAVIVSNDQANMRLTRLQVVPLTSNASRLFEGESLVLVNGKKGKALAHQLTTVSKIRLVNKISHLSQAEIDNIDHALKTQLSLH